MTKKLRIRSLILGVFFTLFFVGLVFRMYYVQVVEAKTLLGKAEQMWDASQVLAPARGTIYDRNGMIMAKDAPAFTVAVNPSVINEYHLEQDVVAGLAEILHKPENELMAQVTKRKSDETKALLKEVQIRPEGWKVDKETADKILALVDKLKVKAGVKTLYFKPIYLLDEEKRYYPNNSLASHILGYFDKEGKARMGLEAFYDDTLKGTPGEISYEKDRKGDILPNASVKYEPAVDGKDIKLTIDQTIQHYIEQKLQEYFDKFKPKHMMGVAMDPATGEILGLANFPNFNSNEYWIFNDQSDFLNTSVSSQYEPGSTFKLVTLAATVEEGLFKPDDWYESGSIRVPGRTIHDHNWSGWGTITYLEGLKRSSNVAFVKLGYEKLGEQKLMEYIKKFGFGEKTGIDLPGETSGLVKFRTPADVAASTYGQGGVTATVIQQMAAYSAIANGGKLMWPHVVKQIMDPKTGDVVQNNAPKEVRQVVTASTAKQVTEYLEQVVSDKQKGTGKNMAIDGYRVAGKTGTAQKVINGKYSDQTWFISFIGYAPAENPKIVFGIFVDEPEIGGNYHNASLVTGPIFRDVMSQSLRYLGIKPSTQVRDEQLTTVDAAYAVPDLSGMTVQTATGELSKRKLNYELLGGGKTVVKQYPKAGEKIGPAGQVYVLTEDSGNIEAPDLSGKSLRDALEICSLLKLECSIEGEGYVKEQKPLETGGKRGLELVLQSSKTSFLEQTSGSAEGGGTTNSGSAQSQQTGEGEQSRQPGDGDNSGKSGGASGGSKGDAGSAGAGNSGAGAAD